MDLGSCHGVVAESLGREPAIETHPGEDGFLVVSESSRARTQELSPILGDGLMDQAAAIWD